MLSTQSITLLYLMCTFPNAFSLSRFSPDQQRIDLSQDFDAAFDEPRGYNQLDTTGIGSKRATNKCKSMKLQVAGIGISCLPRPVVVKFERPNEPHLHLELHRCVGGCFSRDTMCAASKTETICVENIMTVTNHTQCDCKCKPLRCKEHFRFNPNSCSCVCDKTNCRRDQFFDKISCACKCKTRKVCEHGTNWQDEWCKCVPNVVA